MHVLFDQVAARVVFGDQLGLAVDRPHGQRGGCVVEPADHLAKCLGVRLSGPSLALDLPGRIEPRDCKQQPENHGSLQAPERAGPGHISATRAA